MKKNGTINMLEALNDSANMGKEQVITRQVVKHESQNDAVIIDAVGDYPAKGDIVLLGDSEAPDGNYAFDTNEGEVMFSVVKGKIEEIGDKVKSVIRGGVLKKVNVPTVKKRLSSAQKQGLMKARKKAHTPAAQKMRLKSIMKGKLKGLYNSTDVDMSKVDMNALGDMVYEHIFAKLGDNYELSEEMIDMLDEMLAEVIENPIVDGNKITFVVPCWKLNDEVDLENYELKEVSYEVEGAFDSVESIFASISEGELALGSELFEEA